MDDPRAAEILKSLAAGGDAGTAQLQSPDVVRALFIAVDALATAHERTGAGMEARLVKHGRLEAGHASTVRMR